MKGAAYEKGVILYHQRRWKGAAEQFRAAVGETPTWGAPHAMLGLSMMNAGDVEGAHRAVSEALRVAPEYGFAHYAMGHVLLRQRLKRPRFWALSPAGPQAMGRERREAARAAVLEAVRLSPDNADFLAFLAEVEGGLKKWDQSLRVAERGLAADPRHVACGRRRAEALKQLGRAAEARVEVERVLGIEPEDAYAHRGRGWLLLQAGEWEAARDHFAESLRINPEDKDAKQGLAAARWCRMPPVRWATRFGLWSSLAVNRPAMIAGAVTAGVLMGYMKDRWDVEPVVVVVPAAVVGMVVMAIAAGGLAGWRAVKRRRRRRRRRSVAVVAAERGTV